MITILYADTEIELPAGSSGKGLAEKLHFTQPDQALAISINGKISDLSTPLKTGDRISFLSFDEPEGKEVFWHTSAHVLAQAILRLWPQALPTIGPPIEQGFYYDFANVAISEEDFEKIEKEVQKIIAENYHPLRKVFKDRKEALQAFNNNPYKKELIEGFEGEITGYEQGEFFDLCRGPHLPNIGKIKAFKILKTSGAYWRGDPSKEMLTRVYAISFPDRKLLKDYLFLVEEAKKRDHRVIGNKLDLFSFKDAAPGIPFIHPKGMEIWNHLIDYWREIHKKAGYEIILTPQLMTKQLWEISGHWFHYKENMFICEVEKNEYAIKPMNCPGCMLYYKTHSHSYRNFPLKIAEFGHVHRNEHSGAINGLFRVRGFHQDDAHLFMTPSQIKETILDVLHLVEELYSRFGLEYRIELSTRPEKSKTIGTDEQWEIATNGLKEALESWGKPFKINEGDGAFYGPKIDLHVLDAIGRSWQCGTIQLDMALPEKFQLEYMDSDGVIKRPVMIHRAIYGSVERFLGILIEHFAGKFPLWISPLPIRLITVADRHIPYAREVHAELVENGFTCDIDDSQESVSKKIRNAQLLQVNYMLTIGDQEIENQTISLRTRDNVVHGEMKRSHFLETAKKEQKSRSLHSFFKKEHA